jgi:hypothetical protein
VTQISTPHIRNIYYGTQLEKNIEYFFVTTSLPSNGWRNPKGKIGLSLKRESFYEIISIDVPWVWFQPVLNAAPAKRSSEYKISLNIIMTT